MKFPEGWYEEMKLYVVGGAAAFCRAAIPNITC
jgi:hypothetical protein